jgi:hypothetical protein
MAVTPPLPHLVADGRRRSWQLVGLWHGGTSRPGLTRGLSRPEGRQPVTAHVTIDLKKKIFRGTETLVMPAEDALT